MLQETSVFPQAWHPSAALLSSQHGRASSGVLERSKAVYICPVRALTSVSRGEGKKEGLACLLLVACRVLQQKKLQGRAEHTLVGMQRSPLKGEKGLKPEELTTLIGN